MYDDEMAYGTLRPGEPEYADRVARIAEKLRDGATVVVKLTARMTEQQLVIVKADAPYGAVPMHLGPGLIGEYLIVGRFEHGLYVFRVGRGMNAPGYIAEKLGLHEVDAEFVAALLDDLSDVLVLAKSR